MKSVFLFGGFVGFALTVITGFWSGRTMDFVLRDASIACIFTAFLFRWLWGFVVKAFAQTVERKRAEEAAAQENKAGASAAEITSKVAGARVAAER